MRPDDDLHPVLLRPWVAVAGGAVAGVLLATAVVIGWSLLGGDGGDPGRAAVRPDTTVDVYLLPEGALEMLVAPAGPDAMGEPELAVALFPGETPPRELASVLVANSGALGPFDVDLAATPLRARVGGADAWVDLLPVPRDQAERLPPVERLRLRGLGGETAAARVEPGTLRRFLVALPSGRTFRDVSAVQWGEQALRHESLDVEGLHAFRDRTEPEVR